MKYNIDEIIKEMEKFISSTPHPTEAQKELPNTILRLSKILTALAEQAQETTKENIEISNRLLMLTKVLAWFTGVLFIVNVMLLFK